MTTFTITIDAMFTVQQPDPNYVVLIMWTVSGTDEQYTASISGITRFGSTQSDPFIPYDQLTPQIVAGWIPTSDIDSAQACVQGQIDSMITPPVSPTKTPLPWAG